MKQKITLAAAALSLVLAAGHAEPPNHLEPIAVYRSDGYDQAVFRALFGEQTPEAWMVCKTSFAPESALLVRMERAKDAKPFDLHPVTTWTLESAVAAQQIWHWQEPDKEGNKVMKLDLRKDVEIKRKRLVIDKAFGEALRLAWASVLELTRYSGEGGGGLDGTTYLFGVNEILSGKTWLPEKGLPAEIVALALKLEKLAGAEEKQQAALKEECLAEAKRLTRAAKAEAVKLGFRKEEEDER